MPDICRGDQRCWPHQTGGGTLVGWHFFGFHRGVTQLGIAAVSMLVAVVLLLGAAAPSPPRKSQLRSGQSTSRLDAGSSVALPDPESSTRSVPVRVRIPAIDAVSSLIPLGLNPDRTIQVPPLSKPMQAGWYALGPRPGEVGSAVIIGHIDGTKGRGIFFNLPRMRQGNEILITSKDGIVVRFVAALVEQVPKSAFPSDRVYGSTGRPELRLITCGGSFDRARRSYHDNIIVYATLASHLSLKASSVHTRNAWRTTTFGKVKS